MNQNVKLDNKKDLEILITGLSHDGRGIASVNNKTTFISSALPDEVVTYKILKKHYMYNEAKLIEVINASPKRITPPCPHFAICGGCSLQHMDTETQLQFKQKTLLEQLKHFGQVTPEEVLPPLNAWSLGYRRKARLGAKFVIKKNKLLLGFHEKSSSFLADLNECLILHPHFNRHYEQVKQLILSLEQFQSIPQVEIAIGDSNTALIFRHLKPLSDTDSEKLIAFGQTHNLDIYSQPNSPQPVQKLWPQDKFERLSYTLPDHGLEFLFHPLDFTQINLEINRLMVNQALQLLDIKSNETVLDLFCGIGNFTLPIAKKAKHVIGIEGTVDMVARAKENALHNQIANANFYTANLMETLTPATWLSSKYDKILLDPPRAGAKDILAFVPQWQAKKIVYVSCNPATLARDAGILVHQHGYQLKQSGVMNMFPHTAHIEAIAVFEKVN